MRDFDQPIREIVAYFSSLRTDDGRQAVSLAGLHAEMLEDLGHLGEGYRLPTLAQFEALPSSEAGLDAALYIHTYLRRCYDRTVTAAWPPPPSWLATPPSLTYARPGWHVYAPRTGQRII